MLYLVPSGREALAPGLVNPRRSLLPHLAEPRDIHVALPDGAQARLPGALWPTASASRESAIPPARDPHPISVAQVSRSDVNALYERWEHPLGAYRRPFAEQHYQLLIDGQAVAAVSSGSTQSKTVAGGLPRRRVVELARIARAPEHPHALRAMLRLWRCYLAPRWADRYWPVEASVAYALPGKDGALYRFDGWARYGRCRPWGKHTSWSRPSATDQIADGVKTLWIYRYDPPYGEDRPQQLALAAA